MCPNFMLVRTSGCHLQINLLSHVIVSGVQGFDDSNLSNCIRSSITPSIATVTYSSRFSYSSLVQAPILMQYYLQDLTCALISRDDSVTAAHIVSTLDEIRKSLDARQDAVTAVYKTLARMTVELTVSIGIFWLYVFKVLCQNQRISATKNDQTFRDL